MPTYHDDLFGDKQKAIRHRLQNAFSRGQSSVLALLPDTCIIAPATGDNPVMSAKGVVTSDAPTNRLYNGYENIPCRGDEVRSFRPDELEAQISQVGEIDLHLPFDLVLDETDVITYRGNTYKIRKMSEDSDFAVTKVAKIMRLGTSLD